MRPKIQEISQESSVEPGVFLQDRPLRLTEPQKLAGGHRPRTPAARSRAVVEREHRRQVLGGHRQLGHLLSARSSPRCRSRSPDGDEQWYVALGREALARPEHR